MGNLLFVLFCMWCFYFGGYWCIIKVILEAETYKERESCFIGMCGGIMLSFLFYFLIK